MASEANASKRPERFERKLAVGPWYAEGHTVEVAETVLERPRRFAELFECLMSSDKGIRKRASHALTLVSEQRPDLFEPYKEILFNELEEQDMWFVRYRLCKILPRLKLTAPDIQRAAGIFYGLLKHPQNVLNVSALYGLGELALLDPNIKEDIVWLIEQKAQHGTPAMSAAGRKMLKRLRRSERSRQRSRATFA
jgi:hypothetical protein